MEQVTETINQLKEEINGRGPYGMLEPGLRSRVADLEDELQKLKQWVHTIGDVVQRIDQRDLLTQDVREEIASLRQVVDSQTDELTALRGGL